MYNPIPSHTVGKKKLVHPTIVLGAITTERAIKKRSK